jgi:hypothetical protein
MRDQMLCRVGAVASFLLLAYCIETMVQLAVLGGPPASAAETFQLLKKSPMIGLLRLDLPTMAALVLYYPLFLALFASLRRTAPTLALLATALAFAGVTLVIASPTPLSMLALSRKWVAAGSEESRRMLEAAGEAVLASDMWHGTGAFLGGLLVQTGAVLISIGMLRTKAFGRFTAWLGITTHGLDLLHILAGPFVPWAAAPLMIVAGSLYPVWVVLVARGLVRAGREVASGAYQSETTV